MRNYTQCAKSLHRILNELHSVSVLLGIFHALP